MWWGQYIWVTEEPGFFTGNEDPSKYVTHFLKSFKIKHHTESMSIRRRRLMKKSRVWGGGLLKCD